MRRVSFAARLLVVLQYAHAGDDASGSIPYKVICRKTSLPTL